MYLDHQRRIGDALSAAEVEIEHIGSTSVPGLAAKPIIDIVMTVHDITLDISGTDRSSRTGPLPPTNGKGKQPPTNHQDNKGSSRKAPDFPAAFFYVRECLHEGHYARQAKMG
ncbi:GrpB family protein [Pseudarthrobacter sp. AB1]|uniref:GrpB family protein n=1 Tax=Pseudarthrobacter sp. AB1 TaxID=2138309 RepID=UPI002815D0FA|nr:GrpB family protein [Pseudarthrobacter sp. AB1]